MWTPRVSGSPVPPTGRAARVGLSLLSRLLAQGFLSAVGLWRSSGEPAHVQEQSPRTDKIQCEETFKRIFVRPVSTHPTVILSLEKPHLLSKQGSRLTKDLFPFPGSGKQTAKGNRNRLACPSASSLLFGKRPGTFPSVLP